jgi:hypothetical protein
VASQRSSSLSFARDEWNDHQVERWLTDVARVERGPNWPNRYIGGWLDPRNQDVHLDVVVVVPRPFRRLAVALGWILRQRCVFDLNNQQTLVIR